MRAATTTETVQRVVLASSCVVIYNDPADTYDAPNGVLTEENISMGSSRLDYQPYSYIQQDHGRNDGMANCRIADPMDDGGHQSRSRSRTWDQMPRKQHVVCYTRF
mmetsp:Transcript_18487/g.52848  ORF Transcript_18487/g.52848 Transcript_18487/m.52848 type:complete len:106 (+) Transcript_18487:959-1276(+)